jgi:predicted ribosome-associated RNA-binding protein Tma20
MGIAIKIDKVDDTKRWIVLDDTPIYLTNKDTTGIPTLKMANEWSMEKHAVEFPVLEIK